MSKLCFSDLAGVNQIKILEGVKFMLTKQTFKKSLTKNASHASLNWNNPLGDGNAGERITRIFEA